MVTSKLSSLDRRMTLRHVYDHCMQHVEAKSLGTGLYPNSLTEN